MTASSDTARPTVTVEIYSDVVCPWCYIGKRRFERGLAVVADEVDVDFEVSFHPFQLDPRATPGDSQPVFDAYARKFGGPEQAARIIEHVTATAAEDGLEFHLDRALRANTLLAHRLLWRAGRPDAPVPQATVKERLLRAYFTEGLDIGDPDVLAGLAADVGFDRDEITAFLASDQGTAEVHDELVAAHEHGITAVPTYVLNGRWAVPGAQDPETFAQVLRKMAAAAIADSAHA